MRTLTLELATDEQQKQLSRVAADAAEKAVKDYFKGTSVSKEGAQRVHGNGDFAARIREAAILALADMSVIDRYKDEEVKSTYTYPKEYKGPKPILEQVQTLKVLFPQLDITATLEFVQTILPTLQLPAGAEGWFAIPRWQKIADSYSAALELVLKTIASKRKFHNYREGELGPGRLRQHGRTAAMLEQIGEQQKGDILIVPAQYGLRHRGRSVRRAREVMVANEFGLGAFAVGCMALVHPERYILWEELDSDCAGDEYAPGADGGFSRAPIFSFRAFHGRLGFVMFRVDVASVSYGSVSAFLPQ